MLSLLAARVRAVARVRHQILSYYSSSSGEDEEVEVFSGKIPKEKLSISFSRSTGPGGQNVNKLNTKVDIRFHLESADWIPQRVKDKVMIQQKNRLNKNGEFFVTSQVHRTQTENLKDGLAKLSKMLHEASEVHKGPSELTKARIKMLKKRFEQKRRADKKYHSFLKSNRRLSDD